MKINKNIKIFFNYFLGPLLFVWLSWSIYKQVSSQDGLADSWAEIKKSLTSSKIVYLAGAIFLMFLHLSVESVKWKTAIKSVQQVSFSRSFKATLAGLSLSISTPNRIGDYIGRVFYIDEGKRIKVATITVINNISQLIVTVIMGITGMFFLKDPIIASGFATAVWYDAVFYATVFSAALLLLFYFRIAWMVRLIEKLPASKRFSWSIEALGHFNATLLFQLLSLSVIRYIIFILQYYLLFQLFEVDISFGSTWMGISVTFLILAIIPTIALFTDLSVRSSVSLNIISLFSANQLGISLTSIGVWLINLIIPAIIGSILILGIKKIFRNKDENT